MRAPVRKKAEPARFCLVLPPDTEVCSHCNGYGSSMKDPPGVDTCSRCGGSGLITNS